jgi:thiol peroxidase
VLPDGGGRITVAGCALVAEDVKAECRDNRREEKEYMMKERPGLVTIKGNPLTLVGNEVQIGQPAPDFTALDNDLEAVDFSSYRGKVCVISSVPSLDTPVCDAQTRRFNGEAAKLGDDVVILTISMDLPFAQKRWCGAAGVDRVQTLSDHRDASFGKAYGMLLMELRLLARGVLVVDRDGIIRYFQLVREVAEEPDYQAALDAVQKLV